MALLQQICPNILFYFHLRTQESSIFSIGAMKEISVQIIRFILDISEPWFRRKEPFMAQSNQD